MVIFQSLFNLNMAFQVIALEIEHLDDVEAIPLGMLRLYRMTAEELRSAINNRIANLIQTREMRDWIRYAKRKRAGNPFRCSHHNEVSSAIQQWERF